MRRHIRTDDAPKLPFVTWHKGSSLPFLVLLAGLIAVSAQGAGGTGTPSGSRVSDDSLNIPSIFNSILPGTEKKHSLKLRLHPHFGDLGGGEHDNFRTLVDLTYTVNTQWELTAGTLFYFSHGMSDMSFGERVGLGAVTVGTKYRFVESPLPGWESSISGSYLVPVAHPPADITDGFRHLRSDLTFARPIQSRPGLRIFWGAGVDLVTKTAYKAHHNDNNLTDDSCSLTAGMVLDRGALHYTFETVFATTRLMSDGSDDVVILRPGIIWDLPKKWTPASSKSQWLVGLALPVSFGPDGTHIGNSLKVRINFDFKKLFRKTDRKPESVDSTGK